jgi:hypothetical protein
MMESSPADSEMLPDMPSEPQVPSEHHLETVFVSSSQEHGTDISQHVNKSPQIEYPQDVGDLKQQDRRNGRAR